MCGGVAGLRAPLPVLGSAEALDGQQQQQTGGGGGVERLELVLTASATQQATAYPFTVQSPTCADACICTEWLTLIAH